MFLLLLLAYCVGTSWSHQPPELNVGEKFDLFKDETDNFQLFCQGTQELLWNTPLDGNNKAKTNRSEPKDSNFTNASTFTVKGLDKDVEGDYHCYYASYSSFNDWDNVDSTYVGVFDHRQQKQELTETQIIIVSVIMAILILITIAVIIMYIRMKITSYRLNPFTPKRFHKHMFLRKIRHENCECSTRKLVELFPPGQNYEVERDSVTIGKHLTCTTYGWVLDGTMKDPKELNEISITIKWHRASYDNDKVRSLACELRLLVHLGKHDNILQVLGVNLDGLVKGEVWVLVEQCGQGDLVRFLHKHRLDFIDQLDPFTGHIISTARPENEETEVRPGMMPGVETIITTSHLYNWALQIAQGMEYISSMKILHGNIMGRNILLTDSNVLKLTGFSLCRDMHMRDMFIAEEDSKMAIKWVPLETLKEQIFSLQTDVWAYAITVWEIFTFGGYPYPVYEVDNDFIQQLEEGYRMAKPRSMNLETYKLMMNCWADKREDRPSFKEIVERLTKIMNPDLSEVSEEGKKQAGKRHIISHYNIVSPELVNLKDVETPKPSSSLAASEGSHFTSNTTETTCL